jgi:hypothetical protein
MELYQMGSYQMGLYQMGLTNDLGYHIYGVGKEDVDERGAEGTEPRHTANIPAKESGVVTPGNLLKSNIQINAFWCK